MPISSRRCGMITKREAERLCKSFLGDNAPPKLPENFAFEVKDKYYKNILLHTSMYSWLRCCLGSIPSSVHIGAFYAVH